MLAAAGRAPMLWPGASLEFAKPDRGTVFRDRLERGQTFSVTYVHSIYRRPVTEEFAAGSGGELVLTGVRSESGAVLEYFGFADSRPFHAMNRPMRTIVFRVAVEGAQTLSLGDRRGPLLRPGGPGDRGPGPA